MSYDFFKKNLNTIQNKFIFEEKTVNNYKISNANIYKRALAFSIDIFLIVILVSFIFSILISKEEVSLLEEIVKSSKEVNSNIAQITKTISNIVCLSVFLYFFATNIFLKSTIGQKILNLKLISVNNKNITKYEVFNRTLMASCVLILSGVLVVLLFFVIPLILTKHKLTLVDMITNTSIIEFKKIS